jgi:hypothetical protein
MCYDCKKSSCKKQCVTAIEKKEKQLQKKVKVRLQKPSSKNSMP